VDLLSDALLILAFICLLLSARSQAKFNENVRGTFGAIMEALGALEKIYGERDRRYLATVLDLQEQVYKLSKLCKKENK